MVEILSGTNYRDFKKKISAFKNSWFKNDFKPSSKFIFPLLKFLLSINANLYLNFMILFYPVNNKWND